MPNNRSTLIWTRVTLIWLLLIAATAISVAMGHGAGFHDLRFASSAIILVALIKVRCVILEFMEIRTAPVFMRVIAELWVALIAAMLVGLYWRGLS